VSRENYRKDRSFFACSGGEFDNAAVLSQLSQLLVAVDFRSLKQYQVDIFWFCHWLQETKNKNTAY